jgi:hypothetical protein
VHCAREEIEPFAPSGWMAYLFLVRSMKTTFPIRFAALIFSTILVSSGCQKKTAVTNPTSQSKTELDENTKVLRAADLVGYNGTKLTKSVHDIKEASDKRNQKMEKMVESGPDE